MFLVSLFSHLFSSMFDPHSSLCKRSASNFFKREDSSNDRSSNADQRKLAVLTKHLADHTQEIKAGRTSMHSCVADLAMLNVWLALFAAFSHCAGTA